MAATIAKAYAADGGARVTAAALQVHGGIGFTWEHDLHFFLKRAQANAHVYGDARRHRDERVAALSTVGRWPRSASSPTGRQARDTDALPRLVRLALRKRRPRAA